MMRRLSVALVTALVLTGLLASVAFAGNAHFINSATKASIDSSGALVVSFKEAGLESGSVETMRLDVAQASATYGCFNGGGNHPKAANKETKSGPLVKYETLPPVGKNGNLVGSISAGPLESAPFSCPSGQTLGLMAVSYAGITLTDITSGASLTIPGPISKTFISG